MRNWGSWRIFKSLFLHSLFVRTHNWTVDLKVLLSSQKTWYSVRISYLQFLYRSSNSIKSHETRILSTSIKSLAGKSNKSSPKFSTLSCWKVWSLHSDHDGLQATRSMAGCQGMPDYFSETYASLAFRVYCFRRELFKNSILELLLLL